jgi:hypothetical protein
VNGAGVGCGRAVFRDKLIKLGSGVVRHAGAITFQLAEVAAIGPMVRAILVATRRSRATGMCVPPFLDQTERKRQDRSVRRAEERGRRARVMRVRGVIRPAQSVPATPDTAQDEKQLFREQNRTIVPSSRRPSGDAGQERIRKS